MPLSELLLKLFCMLELMLHSLIDAEHWETLHMYHAIKKKKRKPRSVVWSA